MAFPIDFAGRPYNTFTLPCERVILQCFNTVGWASGMAFGQLKSGDIALPKKCLWTQLNLEPKNG